MLAIYSIEKRLANHAFLKALITVAAACALTAVCIMAGYGAVAYGGWIDDKIIKIVLLPLIFFFAALFFYDKRTLFVLLIAARVPIDPLIEAARLVSSLSPGAVMNAFVLLIALLLFLERPAPMLKVVIPLWLPLIIIIIFEALRAPDRGGGIRTALGYFTCVAVFSIPFYLKQCQENMKFSTHLVLLSSIFPVLYGFVDLAKGGYGGGRISGTFPHPNIFAFYLVVIIALLIYKIKEPLMSKSSVEKWLSIGYMLLVIAMLLLTKTRSAWAAALGVFLLYALFFERKYFVYIGGAAFIALLIPSVRDRLADVYTAPVYWGQGTNSYEWRKTLWESSWAWTKPSAVPLGYGLDSFIYHSQEFFPYAYGKDVGAHSVYRQWLFEAGVVGLLCAAWLYIGVIRMGRRLLELTKLGGLIFGTILLAYLIVSYSDNMLYYLAFNWIYWFLLGTVCAISYAKFGGPFSNLFKRTQKYPVFSNQYIPRT